MKEYNVRINKDCLFKRREKERERFGSKTRERER